MLQMFLSKLYVDLSVQGGTPVDSICRTPHLRRRLECSYQGSGSVRSESGVEQNSFLAFKNGVVFVSSVEFAVRNTSAGQGAH